MKSSRIRYSVALSVLVIAFSLMSSACVAFGLLPLMAERLLITTTVHGTRPPSVEKSRFESNASLIIPGLLFASIALRPCLAHAADDVARAGAEIFHANCASCHAGGQNVTKEQRTLKKDALNKFIGGYDVDTIQAFLKGSSRHQNQAYFRAPGGKLTSLDLDDAAAYVSQTATADGW